MAAVQRYPLRIYENVGAACSRVRAGILTGGAEVSAVTKVWPAVAVGDSSVTVVSFILRGVSSRRDRSQKRSEERAAAYRARRQRDLSVEAARTTGADYAWLVGVRRNVCGSCAFCTSR